MEGTRLLDAGHDNDAISSRKRPRSPAGSHNVISTPTHSVSPLQDSPSVVTILNNAFARNSNPSPADLRSLALKTRRHVSYVIDWFKKKRLRIRMDARNERRKNERAEKRLAKRVNATQVPEEAEAESRSESQLEVNPTTPPHPTDSRRLSVRILARSLDGSATWVTQAPQAALEDSPTTTPTPLTTRRPSFPLYLKRIKSFDSSTNRSPSPVPSIASSLTPLSSSPSSSSPSSSPSPFITPSSHDDTTTTPSLPPLHHQPSNELGIWTNHKKSALYAHFVQESHPDLESRTRIAQEVGLTVMQVSKFFSRTRSELKYGRKAAHAGGRGGGSGGGRGRGRGGGAVGQGRGARTVGRMGASSADKAHRAVAFGAGNVEADSDISAELYDESGDTEPDQDTDIGRRVQRPPGLPQYDETQAARILLMLSGSTDSASSLDIASSSSLNASQTETEIVHETITPLTLSPLSAGSVPAQDRALSAFIPYSDSRRINVSGRSGDGLNGLKHDNKTTRVSSSRIPTISRSPPRAPLSNLSHYTQPTNSTSSITWHSDLPLPFFLPEYQHPTWKWNTAAPSCLSQPRNKVHSTVAATSTSISTDPPPSSSTCWTSGYNWISPYQSLSELQDARTSAYSFTRSQI